MGAAEVNVLAVTEGTVECVLKLFFKLENIIHSVVITELFQPIKRLLSLYCQESNLSISSAALDYSLSPSHSHTFVLPLGT